MTSRVAVTGLSGFLGSRLLEIYNNRVIDLYHSKQTIHKQIDQSIQLNLVGGDVAIQLKKASPEIIIHLAAATHIDTCQRDANLRENSWVWQLNVEATKKIVEYCASGNCKLIYLSTECVFDGKKDGFQENDVKNPINWYGITKSAAEEVILNSSIKSAIIRSVVAYHPDSVHMNIVNQIKAKLKSGKQVSAVWDQKFSPTFVDDIILAIKVIIENEFTGIYHVVPNFILSPYQFATLVAQNLGFDSHIITPVTMKDFFGDERASLRLKNAVLAAQSSQDRLGFVPKTPDEVFHV